MDIDPYLLKFSEALRPLVQEIYEKGYRDGKSVGEQEASARLRARLSSVLGDESEEYTAVNEKFTDSENNVQEQADEQRAAPGTVKPAILEEIRKSGSSGMTTREISDRTGFKYNSVRGTVWGLNKDDLIQKAGGGRWIISPDKEGTERLPLQSFVSPPEAQRNEPPDGSPKDGS